MHAQNCEFMIESFSKFHSSLFLEGWFFSGDDSLIDFEIINVPEHNIKKILGYDYGGVLDSLGPNLGFKAEIFFTEIPLDYFSLGIKFHTKKGKRIESSFSELSNERTDQSKCTITSSNFIKLLSDANHRPKVLDLGGRSRSGLDRSALFLNCDVTVFDILPGDNVDVVGDAHELSSYFNKNSFDAIYSVSVFEHLIMPWKVILEINKILKNDGIGFIFTHQTIGMHDLPWDFFRFSDAAWDGLLNIHTGFKILDRSLDLTQYIIPFILRPDKLDCEKSAGFEGSAVLFQKISSTKLNWNVKTADIIQTNYPEGNDGSIYFNIV
jgi:hypothetical protein